MPQGFDRYDRYKAHEVAAKVTELAILRRAFPDSDLTEYRLLWNSECPPTLERVIEISRAGDLLPMRVRRLTKHLRRYDSLMTAPRPV